MNNTFLFSREHLCILLFFAIYIYFCPKLTKNLLPHSYIIEKIICCLIIIEIVLEQTQLFFMGAYDVTTTLPISVSRVCAYICIAILYFKKYHLFNIFFSWNLICSLGEIIFFPLLPYRFPDLFHFLFIISKLLLIYANIYMIEVRKFKVNQNAIKDNLTMCIVYFSFVFLLNTLTFADYNYGFNNKEIESSIVFVLLTTLVYIPFLIREKYFYK